MFNIMKNPKQEGYLDNGNGGGRRKNNKTWEEKISENDEALLQYYQERFKSCMRKGGNYAEYWQNKLKELRTEIENR